MADCEKYTAVTLGPIYDTFNLTSTPGGTWCASYIFSWLAKEMITEMVNKGIPEESFIAPVFCVDDAGGIYIQGGEEVAARGVGLFFDHIIVKGNCLEKAKDARSAAIKKLAEMVAAAIGRKSTAEDVEKWLTKYLRIYIVVKDVPKGEGVIAAFGDTLAALECEPHYIPVDGKNYLLTLFERDLPDHTNRFLKQFKLVRSLKDRWMLYSEDKNEQIRDIESIADPSGKEKKNWKTEEYYCILNSDGDSMGKLFKSCATDEEAKNLSKKSFQYCVQSAEMILEYGGVPLYAGGDDLLAILPVMGKEPDNMEKNISVFALINRLNAKFNKAFADERKANPGKPSLSVGLSIQHIKSPLYEALERAFSLLHDAKASSGSKNGLCVDLQKHSGQSFQYTVRVISDGEFYVSNPYGDISQSVLLKKLDEMIEAARAAKKNASASSSASGQDEKLTIFLSSAGFVMETYSALFLSAINQYIAHGCTGAYIANFFKNMFDNDAQEKYETYLNGLRDYCKLTVQKQYELVQREIKNTAADNEIPLSDETVVQMSQEILTGISKAKPDTFDGKKAFVSGILPDIIRKKQGQDKFNGFVKKLVHISDNIADRCADAVRILRFMTEAPGKE